MYRYESNTERTEGENEVNCFWNRLQNSLLAAAEELIPQEPRIGRQQWITEEILQMMENRRRIKNTSTEAYKELDRQIKRKCLERKEEWLKSQCEEMERLERIDSRLTAEKIRELTGRKRAARSSMIKDRNGNMLTEKGDVLNRWKEYVEELYRDGDRSDVEWEEAESGPLILRGEVERAGKSMK